MVQVRRVTQVSTADVAGGAELVALQQHSAYLAAGWDATLLVGHRNGPPSPGVVHLGDEQGRSAWARGVRAAAKAPVLRSGPPGTALLAVAEPVRAARRLAGHEDFSHPASRAVLTAAATSDVVHLHNLHGRYFDLRLLPGIAEAAPTILTLHDSWLLTGHCAHSGACERWRTGCGGCPDLSVYPAVRRDATAGNWRRKQRIYARSTGRLHIGAPSRWLLDRVDASMLGPAVADARVIHGGVDLEVFRPARAGEAEAARERFGLPQGAPVLLTVANGLVANPWKDWGTLHRALGLLGSEEGGPVTVAALGEEGADLQLGRVRVVFLGRRTEREEVAAAYRASDVYVHAARVDTFPNAVLEGLATGLPVVASAVGGIPEQVRPAALPGASLSAAAGAAPATGILVPPGDPAPLAAALRTLVDDPALRRRLGSAGRADAEQRFSGSAGLGAYVDWAEELAAAQRPS